ncbi:DUF5677 domain-containing protein [Caulobacter sp. FWC2]|uniref:DUF5677 domain-containing protein n=1 Tax=Caulobacter sp. FWC2 TaxID=69664 RepID=UPI000C147D40|nr:DUF5677 domain-containing protein [Caulobacter sp. FWC2]PIB92740.1 hypothetical protein CSW62_14910 [Caulobacter sp. FWC2]
MTTTTSYETFQAALAEIAEIGNDLGEASLNVQGVADDPAVISTALFWRATSHFRAFTVLWQADQILECEIILRSSIEVAICLANLDARRGDFIADLTNDVSATMNGQVRMMRKAQFGFSEIIAAEWARELESTGKRLDLEVLARQADVADLYTYHRVLSGVAVHITGVSIGRHTPFIDAEEEPSAATETAQADRRRVVLWMLPTMLATLRAHASIIESQEHLDRVDALLAKLKPEVVRYGAANGVSTPADGG